MIAIVNIEKENQSAMGLQQYEVRINYKPVCRFTHVREEGLAACLDKAAEAVRKSLLN